MYLFCFYFSYSGVQYLFCFSFSHLFFSFSFLFRFVKYYVCIIPVHTTEANDTNVFFFSRSIRFFFFIFCSDLHPIHFHSVFILSFRVCVGVRAFVCLFFLDCERSSDFIFYLILSVFSCSFFVATRKVYPLPFRLFFCVFVCLSACPFACLPVCSGPTMNAAPIPGVHPLREPYGGKVHHP